MSTAIIELTVRGKGRPRFSMRCGRPVAYNSKTTKEAEEDIVRAYLSQGGKMHYGPVEVSVTIFRAMPKSRPQKRRSEPDVFKPDSDNVMKVVLDALNGIAYQDDRFVVREVLVKHNRVRRGKDCMIVTVKEARGKCLVFTS